MANATFGVRLKESMKKDINKLLGRIITAHASPLSPSQTSDFWNHSLPREYYEAYLLLEKQGFNINSLTHYSQAMWIRVEGDRFIKYMSITNFDQQMMIVPDSMRQRLRMDDKRERYAPSPDILEKACPIPYSEFLEWAVNSAKIVEQHNTALDTANQLIDMCSTVGQLRRMVPDLADYLPRDKQDILRNQSRASSLPHDWAAFDRACVDIMLTAMARNHLLPDGERNWSGYQDVSHAQFD
jgi:hypothetical protein